MASDSLPSDSRSSPSTRLVVARVHDDGRECAVLGGRPDHRRAADVDVLDHLLLRGVAARDGLLERVEVHAHQVHLLDLLLGGRAQVLVLVAPRQQARVQPRVQRLHAPVHHLGEAGEVLDRAHRDPGAGQLARGAAGGDELHAQLGETLRELDDPALVGHRQQRAAHAHLAGPAALDPRGSAQLTLGGDQLCWETNSRTASGSSACSKGRRAASTSAGSFAPGSRTLRCAMIGPVSMPAST